MYTQRVPCELIVNEPVVTAAAAAAAPLGRFRQPDRHHRNRKSHRLNAADANEAFFLYRPSLSGR